MNSNFLSFSFLIIYYVKFVVKAVCCFGWSKHCHSIILSLSKPGTAAELGEIKKAKEINEREVTQAGGHFYPFIVETLRHWSPSNSKTLKSSPEKLHQQTI